MDTYQSSSESETENDNDQEVVFEDSRKGNKSLTLEIFPCA